MHILRLIEINDFDGFKIELIEYLKTHNVNDLIDYCLHGTSLLIYAITHNRFNMVELLVNEYGADVNISLAHTNAVKEAYYNNRILKFLVDHGARITAKHIKNIVEIDRNFKLVKHIFETYFDKHPEVDFGQDTILTYVKDNRLLPYLLKKGARINEENGFSVLRNFMNNKTTTKKTFRIISYAIKMSRGNIINCMKERERPRYPRYYSDDVEYTDNTLMHYISGCHNPTQIIPILLKHGLNINDIDNSGKTPLFSVCKYSLNYVDILLKYGADPKIIDYNNENVLFKLIDSYDTENKHLQYDILDKFISMGIDLDICSHKSKISVLMQAIRVSDFKMVKILINKGANIHTITESGGNVINELIHPLFMRSKVEDLKILTLLKYLEEQKCDMTLCPINDSPPLINAIINKFPINIISILVQNSNINIINSEKLTALNYACYQRNFSLVKFLIKHGADINQLNWNEFVYLWKGIGDFQQQSKILNYLIKHDPTSFTDEVKNLLIEKLHPQIAYNLKINMMEAHQCSNICKSCICVSNILYDNYCNNCIKSDQEILSRIEFY